MNLTLSHPLRRRVFRHPEPGDDGAGAVLPSAPEPEPDAGAGASPPPASEPEPAPFAKLGELLDNVGKAPAAPAAPAAAPGAPVPPAPPAPAAAPADPKTLDLTPPEGMNERASQRWATLTERVKTLPDLERRATEAETALGNVRTMVTQSGLQPEEFTNVLEIGRLFKSSTPAELQQAMQRLDELRGDIALRLGVDAPGVDPLAGYPDLKAQVDAMTLPKAQALEIAKLRHQAAQTTAQRQAESRNQDDVAAFQRNVQAAATQMDAALAERATTPGHAQRLEFIKQHFSDPAKLNAFVTTYQPEQWKAAILMMYDAHVPAAKTPAPPPPQPLRPGNTALGTRTPNGQPVTAESAVMGAFDRLGL